MKYSTIKENPLFNDIKEFNVLMKEIKIIEKSYKKNEFIFSIGDPCEYIGLLLEGEVHIQQLDFYGNQSIITQLYQGEMFAEVFACTSTKIMPVQVCAITDCKVFFTSYKKIAESTSANILIQNLFRIIANKNVQMAQKMEILSKRTIRDKLLTYFMLQEAKNQSSVFEIPFKRQPLADYLCVDRSALSRELNRMQKEEILCMYGSKIQLNKNITQR